MATFILVYILLMIDPSFSFSSFPSKVLTNSQLVLNILSLNTAMPVNFSPVATELKPMSLLNTLSTIPEAISTEPSCSNLHDILKEDVVEEEQTWTIYEENYKSTDALIEENAVGGEEKAIFPPSLSFTIVKENPLKSNSNSNCSIAKAAIESTEKPGTTRSRSNSKNTAKIYDPTSSESLTDSQGYVDDFDESCALITSENNGKKRILSTNDLILKRSSLGVNKAPQSHRFSAGDADKLEKGIKALPSTRSLRDS